MYCSYCGARLPEGAAFCSRCGRRTVTPGGRASSGYGDRRRWRSAGEDGEERLRKIQDARLLGIISVAGALFVGLVGLICGIMGYRLANGLKVEYPEKGSGVKTLNIVGIVISSVMVVKDFLLLVAALVYGCTSFMI